MSGSSHSTSCPGRCPWWSGTPALRSSRYRSARRAYAMAAGCIGDIDADLPSQFGVQLSLTWTPRARHSSARHADRCVDPSIDSGVVLPCQAWRPLASDPTACKQQM
eukprot:TRINITY_DN15794_c0_g1_i2.p2 TRINITY_DN15794_c0_g1~~TRINITY_DN15794_c0_g1_i2.p2  ORF type:complete len:107 (+),score=2.96 TRINITY_DN15794_c0_g1_i2:1158-1478(+)